MSTGNTDEVLQMKNQNSEIKLETRKQESDSDSEEKQMQILEKKLSKSIDEKFQELKRKAAPVRIFPRIIIYALLIVSLILLFRHHKMTVQKMTQKYQLQMEKLKKEVASMLLSQSKQFMKTIEIYQDMVLIKKETITLGTNDTNANNVISEQNIHELVSIENKNLKYLYLWNLKLGDKQLFEIISAPWFKQLKALEINGNSLSDNVLDALVKAKHQNLVWLNFQNNNISEKGLMKLINNAHMVPNLKYINYKNNNIEDIYKIHYTMNQMLPNVKVATQDNDDL